MKNIDKYIIDKTYSLEKTMAVIDANNMGFAIICDNRKLFGVVTDGDIRRYLLKGGTLKENICNAANKNPRFVTINERYMAADLMVQEDLTVVPVINENNELTDILLNKDADYNTQEKEYLNLPLVIMAGGKGTRLRPYTDILPKPLIPVGGVTITEQIMKRFQDYGCNNVFIIVNYMKDFIKAYFGEKEVKQNIQFIEEESFFGTAGGLSYIKGKIKETFFMTNCDVLIDCNYAEIRDFHKKNKNLVTMICAKKNQVIPYGTIEIGREHQILSMKEKPTIHYNINTGVYMIEPEFLDLIQEKEIVHMPQLIERAMNISQRVGTYLIDENQWMDMGQITELEHMKYKVENINNRL